jgi:hypothetical protein
VKAKKRDKWTSVKFDSGVKNEVKFLPLKKGEEGIEVQNEDIS